jgi:signal transduction histidine kinase
VLLLSSLNAGELTLMNEAFDARVLLDECVKRYESLVKEKKITVRTEAPVKLPALGDRAKSARIVQNLLHNAIKFTPEGGDITLRLAETGKKDMVEFEIVDTGMGMPEQQIDRLFQPFQQMDSSIRRQFSGLGLGLTVARRLTDFLGGNLQIKSRRDAGTHVTLTIPQEAAPENLVARHTV